MTNPPPEILPTTEGLSESDWIDAVCDRFKRELAAGQSRLKEYLQACPPDRRDRLMQKLLVLNWDQLETEAEGLPRECQEFPEDTLTIQEIWTDYRQSHSVNDVPWLPMPEADGLQIPSEMGTSSSPLSVEVFLQRLQTSGVLPIEEVRTLLRNLPKNEQPVDGPALAKLLTQEQKLTNFQARYILAGQGESLRLGNYLILDKLGQGGMGMVLKAEHRRMERIVALKVLSPAVTISPAAVQRFHREVKAAARLDHPNIVIAHDADEAKGTHFLVMQYVEGVDLSARVKQHGPLTVGQAIDCVLQTAEGMKYAHENGVIHRDIKPANLLMDRQGTVKILDMGLARLDESEVHQDQLTETGQIMGTVDFMAPEQAASSRDVDGRADIYSLGMTLWYLLTGEGAYVRDTVMQRLMAHQNDPIPSLREACPEVTKELDAVFLRMVTKSPEDRYQSMQEVITALQTFRQPAESKVDADSLLPAMSGSQLVAIPESGHKQKTSPAVSEQTFSMHESNTEIATAIQTTEEKRSSQGNSLPVSWLICGTAGVLTLLTGIVIYLQAGDGYVRVEINDPNIELRIKDSEVVLSKANNGKDITLVPGTHQFQVTREDFSFFTDNFVLKKGETLTVKVEVLEGEVLVNEGSKLIGRKSLPVSQPVKQEPAVSKVVPLENNGTSENKLGIKLVRIPAGEFRMGRPEKDPDSSAELEAAEPGHLVKITQPFEISVHEVTVAQFRAFVEATGYKTDAETDQKYVGSWGYAQEPPDQLIDLRADRNWQNPGFEQTDQHPVVHVSWNDAVKFCEWLSKTEKMTYRLPTEAEWEYACRAGSKTLWSCGNDPFRLNKLANLADQSFTIDFPRAQRYVGDWRDGFVYTSPVGNFAPNSLGLYDMHGNVQEWCLDWYDEDHYRDRSKPDTIVEDPEGPLTGSRHLYRGGSWSQRAVVARSDYRKIFFPGSRGHDIGFRVVRIP